MQDNRPTRIIRRRNVATRSEPLEVIRGGRIWHDWGSVMLPLVAGGDGSPGGDGGGASGGDGNNGGDGGGTTGGDGGGDGTQGGGTTGGDGQSGDGNQEGNEGDLNALPEWARNRLSKANGEAARYRTERNEARTQLQTQSDQIKAINKALGIGEDQAPDPDALQKSNAEKDATIRALKIENAFGAAAQKAGADVGLTLAVLTHGNKLSGLDPEAQDFTSTLEALVSDAVKANPKLKATQVVPKGGAKELNGDNGGGRSDKPVDLSSAIREALT